MIELPSHPISIGKILDLSIRNYLASFGHVLPVVILVAVLGALNMTMQLAFPTDFLLVGIIRLVFAALGIYLNAALLALMWGASLETPSTPGEAMSIALRKFLPMLGFGILLVLAITGGMILLIVPGIILMVSLVLGQYAIIIEDAGPIAAMKRSHNLVWGGNWWKTAAVLTIVALIYVAVFVALGLVTGVFSAIHNRTAFVIIVGLVSSVISAALSPLAVSTGLVLFTELTLRKEGADLEAAIDNL